MKLNEGIKQDESGRMYRINERGENEILDVQMPKLRQWTLDHTWFVQPDGSRLPRRCRAGMREQCSVCSHSSILLEEAA